MILSAKEFRKVWQQQNPNVIHIPSEYELGLMEQYAKYYHEQQVKNCSIPDVVGRSEQLKAEVFTLANKLALAGEGDAAVSMHRIHNRL